MTAVSAAALLRSADGVPAHEARSLLAFALGCQPHELALRTPNEAQTARFQDLVAARADGVPLQYLTGVAAFRTVEVAVGPGVFIPRPETELLAGWVIEKIKEAKTTRNDLGEKRDDIVVVELCAGSGAISLAIAVEAPGCVQYAVELAPDALAWARKNLAQTDVNLVHCDLADALPELDGRADVVVANPPYVPEADAHLVAADVRAHEPPQALFSGPDGLDAIRATVRAAARLLRPGGLVAIEHDESQDVAAILEAFGDFEDAAEHDDLTGRARFATARRRLLAG